MAVFYIGGSPCSGKSTIAGMLTTHYGLASYKLDDDLFAFMEKAARAGKPHSAADLALDFEQTWMRPPQLQAEGEFAIYEEIFPYAMAAIAARESEQTLIAEGAGFLPRLLAQQGVDKSHYICLVPTEAFQRENYARRPWIGQFLADCQDPDAAFDNWMRRDALFAREVLREAEALGYPTLIVDGQASVKDNCDRVRSVFGLG